MKNLIVTASFLAVASLGFSQGTVVFSNIGTGTAISNITTMAAVPSGTAFRAALYYLPESGINYSNAAVEFNGTAIQIGVTANSFALAGQFSGGNRTTPAAGQPNGAPGGAPGWFQVRAWSSTFQGNPLLTFEQAVATGNPTVFAGMSAIIRMASTGDPANQVPATSLVNNGGLKGFYVTPVPEPAAIGLGILGIGALWLLRRRK